MQKRVENILKVMETNEDRLTSLVSSASRMVQNRHYASREIHEVIDTTPKARNVVAKVRVLPINNRSTRTDLLIERPTKLSRQLEHIRLSSPRISFIIPSP